MYGRLPVFAFLILAFVGTACLADPGSTGIVLLHGNGHPTKAIGPLVKELENRGFHVTNPEMPWSIDRRYDKDVDAAVEQVKAAFEELKSKGADKLIIAGHSKGGVFALYYASMYPVDGLVAIAPGGNVAGKRYKKELGDSVAKAKKLIKAGKGDAVATFKDLEGSRGVTSLETTASSYFSWYGREGAMNSKLSAERLGSNVPVLWIVPTDDYPGLKKSNRSLFDSFPSNSHTKLYEPSANHKTAPAVSVEEISGWLSALD